MSIGMPSESNSITVRSPTSKQQREGNAMEDVELGSSNNRRLKAKESDVAEISNDSTAATAEGGSAMKSLIASAMYSGCSVGMVMVNKSLASR